MYENEQTFKSVDWGPDPPGLLEATTNSDSSTREMKLVGDLEDVETSIIKLRRPEKIHKKLKNNPLFASCK